MRKLAFFLLLWSAMFVGFAKNKADVIPPVPNPPRLVNDFAGVLNDVQIATMEERLVAFNDTTSNVICVVTVNDLGDYSAAQFAYEIGDKWGVRSKDKRNGVVILIKPSTGNGDGDVYISVGYDLEGAIPDAIAKRIIDKKMIPELADGNYGAAVDSALAYILPLAAGEITAEQLEDEENFSVFEAILLILFFVVLVVVLLFFSGVDPNASGGNSHRSGGNGGDIYVGPYFGGSNWGGGGTWSSGGFGGFGGAGGFGGGGAGGRF